MRKMLFGLVLLLIGVLLGVFLARTMMPPRERYPQLAAQADAGIDRVVAELELRDARLAEVYEALREQTRVNLVVDWNELIAAGVDTELPMSVSLRGVPVGAALDAVARAALQQAEAGPWDDGLMAWRAAGGVITVSTRERLDRDTVVRLYDVRDLVTPPPGAVLPPPSQPCFGPISGSANAGQSPQAQAVEDARIERTEALIIMIMEHVFVDTWRDAGGSIGSIREFDGRLIVQQTPEAHAKIEELLLKLRAAGLGSGAR